MIKNLKKILPRTQFSRNVLTVMSGTIISQGVLFLTTPILARLFSPADYGIFNKYFQIVTTVAVLATCKYEILSVLPKKKKDAINIITFAFGITVLVSLISLFIILLAPKTIENFLKTDGLGNWMIYLPLSIFLIGTYQILENYFLRKKDYKRLRAGVVSQSLSRVTLNIGIGLTSALKGGLIIGYIGGQIASLIVLLIKRYKYLYINIKKYFDWKYCLEIAREYRKVALPLIPTNFIGSFNNLLPIIFLGYMYNNDVVGLYGIGFTIVNLPMMIIGKALSDVSYKHTIDIINSQNSLSQYVERVVARLLVIGIVPIIFLALFAQPVFVFFLGNKWLEAGLYVQILMPYFFFRFISSPITLFTQTGKTHIFLYFQIMFLIMTAAALMIGKIVMLTSIGCIVLLSISNSICYFVLCLINYKISGATISNTYSEIKVFLLEINKLYMFKIFKKIDSNGKTRMG